MYFQLSQYLHGKPCKVYLSPFDVRLNVEDGDDIVVQPDLLVVCDKSKLDDKGCKGAPDMVIEIISPSSSKKDRVIKFQRYLKYGVREYWLIDPDSKIVQAYILENGNYIAKAYADADAAPVSVLEGCIINLPEVFAE
jgi:Uma2 family endonuclease